MSSTPSKMIVLKSSDGETFELDETVALASQTIKHMIEDGCADSVIPTPNITGKILKKVIEYCNKHAEEDLKVSEEDLKAFDAEFVQVEQVDLFAIILAANYLNIKSLLYMACKTVADMAIGKTVQEIRNHFNIKNDLTPEEEEKIRLENAWAFDHEPPQDEQTQDKQTQDEQTQEEQTQDEQA